MKEAKEWADSYESQPELVYGNTQFAYNYISDTYRNDVDWDLGEVVSGVKEGGGVEGLVEEEE